MTWWLTSDILHYARLFSSHHGPWVLGTTFLPLWRPLQRSFHNCFWFESEFVFITFAATMPRTTPRFPGWWKPWSTHPALGLVACWETQYRKCGEKLLHSCKMLLLFFSLHFLYMQTLTVECPSVWLKFLAEILLKEWNKLLWRKDQIAGK